MYIKVWGCRGSLPSPATMTFDTRRFGGNTSCFEVRTRYQNQEEIFIVDMGTGIVGLGAKLMDDYHAGRSGPIKARIFITHIHLDHTFGMGFFSPIFHPEHHIDFYMLQMPLNIHNLNRQLSGLYDGIRFPRHLEQMPAIGGHGATDKAFLDVKFWEVLDFSTVRISPVELNHPQGCAGWRFEEKADDGSYSGSILAIATDTEHFEGANAKIRKLGHDADLIILDGQYEDEEYIGRLHDLSDSKQGWGHSTPRACIREAVACGAKRLGITHHDPSHDDRKLIQMERRAKRYNRRLKNPVPELFFLREGMEFSIQPAISIT